MESADFQAARAKQAKAQQRQRDKQAAKLADPEFRQQQYAKQKHGKQFEQLSDADKDALLTALQKNEISFAELGEPALKASSFFGQLLGDAKNGYLADPMYGGNKDMKAWVAIGFPGARAAFTEWVDMHNVKYPLGPVSVSGKRA